MERVRSVIFHVDIFHFIHRLWQMRELRCGEELFGEGFDYLIEAE